jgi:hypothetical protein
MTKPLENHDETAYLLGNEANTKHLRRSLRQLRERTATEQRRETLIRNAFYRAKRAADSAIARNAYRLRGAREQWQRALNEGR